MKPEARDLALAILTRIDEKDGTANKTKLLKLLYPADVEYFRSRGETITGFDWICYLYGPWTEEYDDLLRQLETEGAIRLDKWSAKGLEGERITVSERVALESLILGAEHILSHSTPNRHLG